ncbi:phage tail protein [Fulvimarina endophytica]|uniref:Phage tail protein n=1 Tax=Fulvimarina endophytica TaxID=2293836 RepID=A0A371WXZ3_9HYPH|nr:tail fiber protein [Fulvimarina endophytica]RFC61867.1 phage tail protein [Fulvimarina endophytica]
MENFLGEIRIWPIAEAPVGWALCNGQLLRISAAPALFQLLGARFGGDGSTTFALPDLRGRVPLGVGLNNLGDFSLGQAAGAAQTTLTQANLPSHTHLAMVKVNSQPVQTTFNATTESSSSEVATVGAQLGAVNPGGTNIYAASGSTQIPLGGIETSQPNTQVEVENGPTGGSMPFDNHQPYLAINYIIAITGLFPKFP